MFYVFENRIKVFYICFFLSCRVGNKLGVWKVKEIFDKDVDSMIKIIVDVN